MNYPSPSLEVLSLIMVERTNRQENCIAVVSDVHNLFYFAFCMRSALSTECMDYRHSWSIYMVLPVLQHRFLHDWY